MGYIMELRKIVGHRTLLMPCAGAIIGDGKGNGHHLAWRGEPPGCSRVAAGALDLRWGPQGPALVASRKASPHES